MTETKTDVRLVATISEQDGRLFVTANQTEPLPDARYADARLNELVSDGWQIADPAHLLDLWDIWPEPVSARELDADAAGYPDTPLPAVGTPMGDALMSEEQFFWLFGADNDELF